MAELTKEEALSKYSLLYTVAEREYFPKLSSQLRAGRRRLCSLFPHHVGKPGGLLRATVAADLDRYTTQVSPPDQTGQCCITRASNIKQV